MIFIVFSYFKKIERGGSKTDSVCEESTQVKHSKGKKKCMVKSRFMERKNEDKAINTEAELQTDSSVVKPSEPKKERLIRKQPLKFYKPVPKIANPQKKKRKASISSLHTVSDQVPDKTPPKKIPQKTNLTGYKKGLKDIWYIPKLPVPTKELKKRFPEREGSAFSLKQSTNSSLCQFSNLDRSMFSECSCESKPISDSQSGAKLERSISNFKFRIQNRNRDPKDKLEQEYESTNDVPSVVPRRNEQSSNESSANNNASQKFVFKKRGTSYKKREKYRAMFKSRTARCLRHRTLAFNRNASSIAFRNLHKRHNASDMSIIKNPKNPSPQNHTNLETRRTSEVRGLFEIKLCFNVVV